MSADHTPEHLTGLISELRRLPAETGWVEFKENVADPNEIGEYISALSNTAALERKPRAYLAWGIQDSTHEVVGTRFKPTQAKKGNENLENWLLRLLDPQVRFRFLELTYEEQPVVLLEILCASASPVRFGGQEFIRVGSYKKKLRDHPEIERELWHIFDTTPFEELKAAERLAGPEVLNLLDYPSYFDLLKQPLPSNREAILARLADDRMIVSNDAGTWDITNLGAILFAKRLRDFRRLERKALRIIVYDGKGRLHTKREEVRKGGYASGFEALIGYLDALLPRNEVLGPALREEVPMYPILAVRELAANALIHQDFAITGTGPMIEIFDDRMEITNPGKPLVSTDRFLDTAPRSRNEALASFMRRAGICEERGSGIDKVVFETELHQLPAPFFEMAENATRAVLFAHKELREMRQEERIRACYLHACLRYVERDPMTNSSLRKRFGIAEHNRATASRIIGEALQAGRIKPFDPHQGKKYAKYLPFWA